MRIVSSTQLRYEYVNGATVRELAKKHQLSFGTTLNLLRSAGTPMRPKGRRPGNQL